MVRLIIFCLFAFPSDLRLKSNLRGLNMILCQVCIEAVQHQGIESSRCQTFDNDGGIALLIIDKK